MRACACVCVCVCVYGVESQDSCWLAVPPLEHTLSHALVIQPLLYDLRSSTYLLLLAPTPTPTPTPTPHTRPHTLDTRAAERTQVSAMPRMSWQLHTWLRPHFLDPAFLGRAARRWGGVCTYQPNQTKPDQTKLDSKAQAEATVAGAGAGAGAGAVCARASGMLVSESA